MDDRAGVWRLLVAAALGCACASVQGVGADAAADGSAADAAEYAKLLALVERQRAPVKRFQADLDVSGLPVIGQSDAPVTVVEFGSPGCAFCKRHAIKTMPALMQHVASGEISYVFYDYPIQEDQRPLVEAALCADEQDGYLAFRDEIGVQLVAPTREELQQLAQRVGLEAGLFGDCLEAGHQYQRVSRLVSNGRALGIKGTPTFLIGVTQQRSETLAISKRIDGAQPYSVFANEIAALLEAR